MGREIRKVPPNWKHPEYRHKYAGDVRLQPMFDRLFKDAMEEWLKDLDRVRSGNFDDKEREWYPRGIGDWLKDHSPPNIDYYRPWSDEEATWFQVWETVSEGTPVTPPFATPEELIDYLTKNGDFWDQKRGEGPWSRSGAESFVKRGWACSLVMQDGQFFDPKDQDKVFGSDAA